MRGPGRGQPRPGPGAGRLRPRARRLAELVRPADGQAGAAGSHGGATEHGTRRARHARADRLCGLADDCAAGCGRDGRHRRGQRCRRAIAGQLAKLEGCWVVGVAGGAEKCRHVTDELGFDLCLDRYQPDLAGRLREACPNGIDVYVELVGSELFWAVLPLLNLHARIPVIGGIAWYNLERPPEGPDRTPQLMRAVLTRRLRIEGLLIPDHADLAPEFRRMVAPPVQSGRLRFKEDVVVGLDKAPAALIGMLEGRNFGKLLVQVSPDPPR